MNASSKSSSSSSSSSNPVVTYTSPYPLFAVAWSSHTAPHPHASSSSSSSSSSYLRGHSTSSSISTSPSRFDDASAIPHGSRIAVGSFMEECSNSIQVLGYIGERDPAGQARLSALATANHPYPATKIAFQPSSLSTASSSSSSSSSGNNSSADRERGYMSPTSKSAKRGSWGTGHHQQQQQQQQQHGSSPEPQLVPNDEAHDGFPNRELLATTADCLRIWECARNADAAVGSGWGGDAAGGAAADETGGALEDHEAASGMGTGHNGYVGWPSKMGAAAAGSGKMRFNLREKSVLAHSKSSVSPPAPLTSFSWNQPSPNLIVTSSIDTTCTVWDLPTRTALTQLIAHDREVYDVDWCPGSSDVFASVGADGSVRVFDLRSLEHSTIIYETAGPPPPTSSRPGTGMSTSSSRNGSNAGGGGGGGGAGTTAAPLLRIAFNPWDANYLATFHLESDCIQILDVRAPGLPILELKGHKAAINAVAWGPPSLAGSGGGGGSSLGALGGAAASPALGGSASSSSSAAASSISKGMICTASDDAQVLLYDLASSTLRSASAQGRRSRNSNAAAAAAASSPAPAAAAAHHHHHSLSHSMSSASLSSAGGAGGAGVATPWATPGIPAETPFMAWDAPEMVNNVAWFRPASAPNGGTGHGHGHSRSGSMGLNSVVAEWNEYAANARGGAGGSAGGGGAPRREDWMAAVAGKELRALRVA